MEHLSYPYDNCPVLITERLVLRAPCHDDIPDIVELADNIAISRMVSTMPSPYGESDAREFLQKIDKGVHPGCTYALTLAASGTFVGCAGIQPKADGPEIGYWVGQPFWDQGYATEAVRALVELGFRSSDHHQIKACCRTVNPASRRVLEKCGFSYTGKATRHSLVAGEVPIDCFALNRNDWLSKVAIAS